jgi:hypothetical protein
VKALTIGVPEAAVENPNNFVGSLRFDFSVLHEWEKITQFEKQACPPNTPETERGGGRKLSQLYFAYSTESIYING